MNFENLRTHLNHNYPTKKADKTAHPLKQEENIVNRNLLSLKESRKRHDKNAHHFCHLKPNEYNTIKKQIKTIKRITKSYYLFLWTV